MWGTGSHGHETGNPWGPRSRCWASGFTSVRSRVLGTAPTLERSPWNHRPPMTWKPDRFQRRRPGVREEVGGRCASVAFSVACKPPRDPTLSGGAASSVCGFVGKQKSGTGQIYLRARYYGSGVRRFVSRDVRQGDSNQAMSYIAWLYVYARRRHLSQRNVPGLGPGRQVRRLVDSLQSRRGRPSPGAAAATPVPYRQTAEGQMRQPSPGETPLRIPPACPTKSARR
jgi:hypothetical protein